MSEEEDRVPYARVSNGKVVVYSRRSRTWGLGFLYSEGVFKRDNEPPEMSDEEERRDTEILHRKVSSLEFTRSGDLKIRSFSPVGADGEEVHWRQLSPNSVGGGKLASAIFNRSFKIT